MVSGLLALLTVVVGPGSGPERAADRYRVDLNMKQAVDLSSAGMGVQESSLTAVIFMNVTMSDTAGGRIAHVVIDSMTTVSDGQFAQTFTQILADSARGAFIHAYIAKGKLEGKPTLSVEGNAALALATQGLSALFPGVSPQAAEKQGWADTVSTHTVNEMVDVTSNQIVTWTVTGKQGDMLTLTGNGEGTVTGEQSGNPVSGTVKNTLAAVTAVGGPATNAELSSVQDMTVLVAQLPEPVVVKINSSMKLTPLP